MGIRDTGLGLGWRRFVAMSAERCHSFSQPLVLCLRAAALAGVIRLVTGVVDQLDELRDRARETRTSVEDLSRLEFAGRLNGINDVTGLLNHLTKSLGMPRREQRAGESFRALGIDAGVFVRSGRSAVDILPAIVDALARMDATQSAGLSRSIFGRSGFDVMRFGERGRDSAGDATVGRGRGHDLKPRRREGGRAEGQVRRSFQQPLKRAARRRRSAHG